MRRLVVPAAAALLLAACKPQPLSQADQDAVRAVNAAFTAAVNADNLSGMSAVFADDATLNANNMPPAVGAAAVRQTWKALHDSASAKLTTTVTKVDGEGDLAYTTGTYHLVLTMRSTHADLPAEDGKFVTVAKRQSDGSWKWVVDTWNANAMPAMPAPPPARRH